MQEQTNHFFNSDFWKQYSDPYFELKQSAAKQAQQRTPEIEFGRLCYELFIMHEDGRKLWELLKEELISGLHYNVLMPNPEANGAFIEGQRTAYKRFYAAALQHQTRIAQQEGSQ